MAGIGVNGVSVSNLAAAVRTAAAALPLDALAEADRNLAQAQSILAGYAEGSHAPELPGAVEGYAQAQQAVGLANQACEHVGQTLERYLHSLGAVDEAGSVLTTTAPSTTPASKPKQARSWKTVAEEHGLLRSFPSYSAAKRALGSRQGQELHHIVEQCQAKPERSGFATKRVNTTDNFVWLPLATHRKITAFYARKPPGMTTSRRDAMNEVAWDEQYRRGQRAVTRAIREDEARE